MYAVLAGGVGAARFLSGLVRVVNPEDVTAIVNTGDDIELWGLHISPDIDINIYTLAGAVDPLQGWGIAGDTLNCLGAMRRYTEDTWFQLGDRDLATHIHRTRRLREGQRLSAVTAELAERWGVRVRVLPMSDDPVATRIRTPAGEMHFEEYLVKRRAEDPILAVRFEGAAAARPAPGVLEALARARAILLPPSNPVVSVGTILAVPGIREAIEKRSVPCVAVSPIVGGRTVKGPADRLLEAQGHPVSPVGVARHYRGLIDGMVIDRADAELAPAVQAEGVRVAVTDTLMTDPDKAADLARAALGLVQELVESR